MAGVLRTKRMPARTALRKCSRGREEEDVSRRQVSSAESTATNDVAYSANVRPDPPTSTSTPPNAGPIARARLKPMPFRAIACTRSSRGTSSGASAPQAGAVIAEPMPIAKVSASRLHTVISPISVSAASSAAAVMVQVWVISRNRRRSTMSAIAPAGSASRHIGRMVAACTRLTVNGSGDRVVISQPAPVFCSQTPNELTTKASHIWRNTELRSGSRAGGRVMARQFPWRVASSGVSRSVRRLVIKRQTRAAGAALLCNPVVSPGT